MLLLESLKEFLSSGNGYGNGNGNGDGDGDGDGYGDGNGNGDGDGDGYGDGNGNGNGDGDGYGDGDGNGNGNGYGNGVLSFEGMPVRDIDGVQTAVTQIRGNVLKGYILGTDLSLDPCFVVKAQGCFAHGKTLAEATREAESKAFEEMDEDERIESFWKEFDREGSYPGSLFFDWHSRLTGSCRMGRESFVKDRGIDLDAKYTVAQFLSLTKGAYGSEILAKLEAGK